MNTGSTEKKTDVNVKRTLRKNEGKKTNVKTITLSLHTDVMPD